MKNIVMLATLTLADRAYRSGAPIMTDAEYDTLAATVILPRNRRTIGNDNRPGRKKHTHRGYWNDMQKTRDLATITAHIPAGADFLIEPKIDGVAICLTYKRGRLHHAALRGNDYEGDDITGHITGADGIPATLPIPFTGEIRGELHILKTDLAACPKTYATPRDATAAALNHKDPATAHTYPLRFLAYKTTPASTARPLTPEALATLARAIPTAPFTLITADDDPATALRAYATGLRPTPLPTDGIIIHPVPPSAEPPASSPIRHLLSNSPLLAWKF